MTTAASVTMLILTSGFLSLKLITTVKINNVQRQAQYIVCITVDSWTSLKRYSRKTLLKGVSSNFLLKYKKTSEEKSEQPPVPKDAERHWDVNLILFREQPNSKYVHINFDPGKARDPRGGTLKVTLKRKEK